MTPSSPTSPAACSVRAYSGEYAVHAHAHAQVVYALAGRMELEVAGRALWVDRASGIVVPAGVRHGFSALPGARFCVFDLPEGSGTERVRRFAVPPQARSWIDAAAARWTDAGVQGDAAPGAARAHWPDGVAQAWPAQAAAQGGAGLPQQLAGLLQAPRLLARRDLAPARLEQAVRRALHEDWPTARMAALCHMSVPRFHTRWSELCGATPQAWLRGVRLDAAERQLAAGQPLERVALACGYATGPALAAALRRERGTSARELRELRALRGAVRPAAGEGSGGSHAP
ncbi:AraC family transcriptional regulator [Paracidovorax wautersii]|uniref:AraC family transcriptional regulator n=1 Tax=Paracidovorax wautersii TaxID=1177982 RepID=UPI0031CDF22E